MNIARVSSRHFLASAAALALLAIAGCVQAPTSPYQGSAPPSGSAPPAGRQVPGYWRMAVGDAVVTALFDGRVALSPSILKGIAGSDAERLLAAMFVPQSADGVQTAVNAYLIDQGGRLTLIDAGAAACFGPTLGQIVDNLAAAGYAPSQVNAVVLTHLHGDHVCGVTSADGKRVFANAEIYAAQADADFWLSEAIAAAAPEGARGFFKAARDAVKPYQAAGRFKTFAAGADPLPGVKAVPSNGHTPGHTSYLVESQGQSLLIWGDIVHSHSIQFQRPEVALEFDVDTAAAIATRKRIFAQAADGKLWVAGAHLPFPGLGHVRREADAWRWLPAEYGPLPAAAKR